MMVSVDRVERGIAAYADREIVGKLPGIKRIVAGAAVALAIGKTVDGFLRSDAARTLGVCNGDDVDVDAMADAIKSSINADGETIQIAGLSIKFTPADVDAIKTEIEATE